MSHKKDLEDYKGKYKKQREWQKNNSDKLKEYTARYIANNREKYLARCKEYRKKYNQRNAELGLPSISKISYEKHIKPRLGSDEWMSSRMFRQYGITLAEKQVMFENQNGKCAICGSEFESIMTANIDHCHESKDVRWLLCNNCNTGLGLFRDNPDLLRKAADLLENKKYTNREQISKGE